VPARRQARYTIPAGTRGLDAQRIDGHVALVDVPIDDADRVLLLERHVESLAELHGVVADYVEHSTRAGLAALMASRRSLDGLAEIASSDQRDAAAPLRIALMLQPPVLV
jgi:hypothetical protein